MWVGGGGVPQSFWHVHALVRSIRQRWQTAVPLIKRREGKRPHSMVGVVSWVSGTFYQPGLGVARSTCCWSTEVEYNSCTVCAARPARCSTPL